jgi:L-tartrate/succinate antiporter
MSLTLRAAIPLAVGVILALLPLPAGLAPNAWHYFRGVCGARHRADHRADPGGRSRIDRRGVHRGHGACVHAAQQAAPGFKLSAEAIRFALAGFANSTVWLIFGSFVFAMGYEKTGLGRRISLVLVRGLGGRTLGLGYAIMLADLVLSPFTPSNTARSAGNDFPVIRNVPEILRLPAGRIAAEDRRLPDVGGVCDDVRDELDVHHRARAESARAGNHPEVDGIEISWMQWFLAFLPIWRAPGADPATARVRDFSARRSKPVRKCRGGLRASSRRWDRCHVGNGPWPDSSCWRLVSGSAAAASSTPRPWRWWRLS